MSRAIIRVCGSCYSSFRENLEIKNVLLLCPFCHSDNHLPLLEETDPIPDSVLEEVSWGKGEMREKEKEGEGIGDEKK